MNVAYFCSDLFSGICAVSIESLCENNTDIDEIRVYIIEEKITNTNKNRLNSIVNKFGREIIFIKMPLQHEIYADVKINLGHTYTRMAIGELLPEEVDRVICLDSDTLITDSLKEMYATEFADHEYVGGVYDCVGSAIQEGILHYDKSLKYCNAGMFLIDLKKWRSLDIGAALIHSTTVSAENRKILYFLEQDLMNLTFYGHLKLLHPRYNMLTSIYIFDYEDIIKMKKPTDYYKVDDVVYAKQHPAILHATTCFYVKKRMWVEKSDHPYARLYVDYRNRTPWKDDPQMGDKRKMSKKIYAAFWHCIPKGFAIILASWTINHFRPFYAKMTSKLNLSTIANQSST